DIYKKLFPYFRPYKKMMVLVIGIEMIYTVVGLASPWPLAILIDNALRGHPLPHVLEKLPFLSSNSFTSIVAFVAIATVLYRVVRDVMSLLIDYLKTKVNWMMVLRFKADLFQHLQKLSFSYHDRVPVGDSIYRVE